MNIQGQKAKPGAREEWIFFKHFTVTKELLTLTNNAYSDESLHRKLPIMTHVRIWFRCSSVDETSSIVTE